MKKLILAFFCIISLTLISCESAPETPETVQKAPELEQIQADDATSTKIEVQETPEHAEMPESANNYKTLELPEISEPEVITLPPQEEEIQPEIKQEVKDNPEEVKKDENLEELINEEPIPDLPLPEMEIIEELPAAPDYEITTEIPTVTENILPLPEEITVMEESETEDKIQEQPEVIEIIPEIKDIPENKDKIIELTEQPEQNIQTVDPETEITESVKTEPVQTENEQKITEQNEQPLEEIEEEIKEEKNTITPSRSVTVKRREYVDISYPGKGWIYMGITDNSKDLTYFGRSLGAKDTSFTLQAKNAGTKILHFYKNDNLTGEYIDDYIEVIVLDKIGSNKTHIKAPSYKQPIPESSKELFYKQEINKQEEKKSDKTESAKKKESQEIQKSNETESRQTSADLIIIDEEEECPILIDDLSEKNNIPDTETLLQEANLLYNEKEYEAAYEKIEEFLNYAVKNIDEGLFLKGKILEENSPIQNIKNAINAYTTLTKEYPASRYWEQANKRIVYLKRFYLEVR